MTPYSHPSPYHEHWIDGHKTADLIDFDEAGRALEGVLAVQVHVGPKMTIESRWVFSFFSLFTDPAVAAERRGLKVSCYGDFPGSRLGIVIASGKQRTAGRSITKSLRPSNSRAYFKELIPLKRMKQLFRHLLASLGLLLLASSPLLSVNRVFVKAEAFKDFQLERAQQGANQEQTYQFMKGTYLPGNRLDHSMEELSFDSMVYDLALQLRKKDFYPEPVLGESDLLIVVHYGSTGYADDFTYYEGIDYWTDQRFQYFDELGNFARPHGLDHLHSSQLFHVRDNSYRAKLLGMDFNRTWASDKRLLSTLSNEPRYFAMLYAYDFPALKEGEIKLQWRTRYSIRSVGQSFTEAIIDMNRIASDYMGENMKGFTQKRVDDSSFVSYGEIEVIDEEEIETEDRRTGLLIQDTSHLPQQILQPSFEK